MKEIVLNKRKNGMTALIGIIVLLTISVIGFIFGCDQENILLITVTVALFIIASFLFAGLKVLKPQEALVLTLFGKYVGTLKEDGFYFVNPFCTAINPAAKTKLSQSGDVGNTSHAPFLLQTSNTKETEYASNKISLKMMTLNNAVQKINDCLGNPVEIGIAVIWKVNDTYKAVFNVDNYKEYLSLQCDSALRNVVRVYPGYI